MKSKEKKLLELHEGKVYHAYQDSMGYWSIGVGFLIDKRRGGRVPEEVVEYWTEVVWSQHRAALLKVQPWVADLDEVRQYVMYDMTYNLGVEPFDGDGFKDWPDFIKQMKEGSYAAASENMLTTLWARQVRQRAWRLAEMVRSGEWPQEAGE
jgi:lysozyme